VIKENLPPQNFQNFNFELFFPGPLN